MCRIVLPVVPGQRVDPRAIDVDVVDVVAPVDAAAPVISTRCPASERPGAAEGKPGAKKASAVVAGVSQVVRGIGWIGPAAIDHIGIIIRHVNRIRVRLLDRDGLATGRPVHLDDALLGRRCQLVVGVGSRAKALDRIHHIRLLGEHGIAELLRPVELCAHRRQNVGHCGQRLDAFIPTLLVDCSFQRIILEILVLLRPPVRLYDLERIRRSHQNRGQK